MVKGSIKIGKNTLKHGQWLHDHGYEVTEKDGILVVEGKGELLNELNLGTDPIAVLKGMVEKGDLLSYSTKVSFPDGKVLFGVPACMRLGQASALIVKPEKAQETKKASGFNF